MTTPSPRLKLFTLAPPQVVGGEPVQGSVELAGPAPAGGARVMLTVASPSVRCPPSANVPAGGTRAAFELKTTLVDSRTSIEVEASYGEARLSAPVELTPRYRVATVSVSPVTIIGGNAAGGTVRLSEAAPPGGIVVQLDSASDAAATPASVTVAEGRNDATFEVDTSPVEHDERASVFASYGDSTVRCTLTVTPPRVASLTVDPSSVVGGNPVKGTVSLTGPAPPVGATVPLTSSSDAVRVPASVLVAGEEQSAGFAVETVGVASDTEASIGARGAPSRAALRILPASVASVRIASPIAASVGATIVLDGAAPPGGAAVRVTSPGAVLSVPGDVTVPAGESSAAVQVSVSPVARRTETSLDAVYRGALRSTPVTVDPGIVSLTFSPPYGNYKADARFPVEATLTLSGPAPEGGAHIAWTAVWTSRGTSGVEVPPTTVVPAGQATGSCTVVIVNARGGYIGGVLTVTASYESSGRSGQVIFNRPGE